MSDINQLVDYHFRKDSYDIDDTLSDLISRGIITKTDVLELIEQNVCLITVRNILAQIPNVGKD